LGFLLLLSHIVNKRNFDEVFRVFSREPLNVPLEVFHKNPYKILVSTLLSSRTKDETTLVVSNRLFKKAPNIKSLNQMSIKTIEQLIYPVGFYKTKARNLKKLADSLEKNFNNKVPITNSDLVTLPGVGRKTANLVLNRAFGKPAISVDTHVHKITNLLGWVSTKTPEQTERELTKILPKKYWGEINRRFVSVGRKYNSKKKLSDFLKKNKFI
jgi:endonuclease III